MRPIKGFTLIEMMVVLMIVAVLAMFAYPAYQALMARVESKNISSTLLETFRRAKISAMMHQKDTIMCLTNASGHCDRYGQAGVLVFVDNNYNNRFDNLDILVHSQQFELRYGKLQMNASLGRSHMKFMGDTAKPRGNFGNIRYCSDANLQLSHQIVLNMHGNLSVKKEKTTEYCQ